MKTDKIYFPSKNGIIDSELVKAIEILPEDWLILPEDAELECTKKDGKIIIYPHNPEQRICTLEHIEAMEYKELIAFSTFKIMDFNYKVLSINPAWIYEEIFTKKIEPAFRIICKALDSYHHQYSVFCPCVETFGELYTYWEKGKNVEYEIVMRGANGLEKLCKIPDNGLIAVTNNFNDTSMLRFKEFKEKYLDKTRKIYLDINEFKKDKNSIYNLLNAGLKVER